MISKTLLGILSLSLCFLGCLAECSGEGGAIKCPAGKTLQVVDEEVEEVKPMAGDPFSFDDIFDPQFSVKGFSHTWLHGTNEFAYRNSAGDLHIRNAETGDDTKIIDNQIFTDNGVSRYWVSEDREYVLLAWDYKKVWRHSFEARYKMYHIDTGALSDFPNGPLGGEMLQIARLGPKAHSAAFVYQYNLYYQANMVLPPIQITSDGQENVIFNAIPDWMYEEDVLHSEQSFYFSKDGGHLLFARLDDTDVPHQAWPIYKEPLNLYPELVEIPYPKAGDLRDGKLGPTTLVQLWVFSTARLGAGLKRVMPPLEFVPQDHYFNQVTWRDGHNVVITWVNRAQNRSIQMICDVYEDDPVCTLFREHTQEGGWADCRQPTQMFVNDGRNMATIAQDPGTDDLFRQLTWMSTPERGHGVVMFHTIHFGDVYQVVGFDEEKQHIFYIANGGNDADDSTERMLYRAGPIANDRNPICLTCNRRPDCAYVTATFSGDGKHYILGCRGPKVPEYYLKKIDDPGFEEVLEDNAAHKAAIAGKDMPTREFKWVQINGGYMARAEIFKPPNFNENNKYPLFVYTYAGAESTRVYQTYPVGGYSNNWLRYLSSTHNAVVASIDGRGTTGRGEKYTFHIYRKLGDVEVQDQIEGTRDLRELDYIDTSIPTAIYGWSYGGHTAAHAIGDPSDVFQCGIAVAPVTAKTFYDSAFSERYLGFATEEDNAAGYDRENVMTRVHYFKGKEFFTAHGTADDNVHLMHMTHLVKAMQDHNIPHHQMIYIDTNHNIAEIENAKHLRRAKTEFLLNRCWKGKYGTV